MVRLITHNLLSCHSRLCSAPTNYPLRFQNCTKVEIRPSQANLEFLRGFLNRVDWEALRGAATALGDEGLPEAPPETEGEPDEAVWQAIHHALMEIHVLDGEMVCPQCAHVFAIKDGIPNMLLAEHEIRR